MLLKHFKNPTQVFQCADSTLYIWDDNSSNELASSVIRDIESKPQKVSVNSKEKSASDYYSNNLATTFNQMLKTLGVKNRFHEQYTNDQTCLLFYGTDKQLQNANEQYKLFKKKKGNKPMLG